MNTKTVFLRAPEPGDVDVMYEWENDPEGWESGDSLSPMSRDMLERFVSGYDGDILSTRQLRMIVVDSESMTAVGIVDIFDYDPINSRAAVGIIIDKEQRGKGYGLATLEATKSYCHRRLALNQLHAVIAAGNIASRRTFASAGFNVCGTLKQWLARGGKFTDAVLCQCFPGKPESGDHSLS